MRAVDTPPDVTRFALPLVTVVSTPFVAAVPNIPSLQYVKLESPEALYAPFHHAINAISGTYFCDSSTLTNPVFVAFVAVLIVFSQAFPNVYFTGDGVPVLLKYTGWVSLPIFLEVNAFAIVAEPPAVDEPA